MGYGAKIARVTSWVQLGNMDHVCMGETERPSRATNFDTGYYCLLVRMGNYICFAGTIHKKMLFHNTWNAKYKHQSGFLLSPQAEVLNPRCQVLRASINHLATWGDLPTWVVLMICELLINGVRPPSVPSSIHTVYKTLYKEILKSYPLSALWGHVMFLLRLWVRLWQL